MASRRIFIGYSRKDELFVMKLAAKLKRLGTFVWMDQWDVPSGVDWDRAIDDALYDCTHFLIVLSPDSVDSDEVRSELRIALDEKKVIVPILFKPCRIPRRLRLIQYVDFTSSSLDDDDTIEKILNATDIKKIDTVDLIEKNDNNRAVFEYAESSADNSKKWMEMASLNNRQYNVKLWMEKKGFSSENEMRDWTSKNYIEFWDEMAMTYADWFKPYFQVLKKPT